MFTDRVRIFGTVFLFFAAQTAIQIVVPLAASGVHLAGATIGFLLAIPAGLGLLIDIPISTASDAIGRRAPIFVGAVLGLVSAAMFLPASDLTGFAIPMGLWAVAASLIQFPTLAYITETAPRAQHARIQGYNGSVQRVAFLAASLLVGFVLERQNGVALAFGIVGFCTVLIAGLTSRLTESVGSRTRASIREVARGYGRAARLLRRPPILLSALIALTNGAVVLVIGNSFIPLYLVRDIHMSPAIIGGLLAWRNLVAAGLSYYFGGIASRVPLLTLVIFTNALAALSVLLLPLSTSATYLFLVLGLQGIGYAFSAGSGNLLIASATGTRERALGFATNQVVARVGTLVLPLILGSLMDTRDTQAVFYIGGSLVLLNVACMAVVATRIRGRTPEAGNTIA